jgi:hypothetical protein
MLPNRFLPQLEGAFAKPIVVGCGGWLPGGTLQLAWNGKYVWALANQPAESVLTWRRRGEFGYFDFDTHPPDPVASGCGPRSWTESQPVVHETLHHPERIELTGHGPDGQCWTGSSDPEFQDLVGHPEDLAGMVPTPTGVAVGIGRHLEIFHWNRVLASYNFDRPIRRLYAGRCGRRTAIVIGFECGVQLHWLGSDDVLRVDDEVVNPVAALTADGRVVVTGDHWGRVYDSDWRGVSRIQSFHWPAPAPVAVMPTPSPSEFATLSQDGTAQIWSMA